MQVHGSGSSRQGNILRGETKALAARIHDETLAAKETGKRHPHLAREPHREAGARRDGRYHWDSRHRRLLDNLKTAATTHDQGTFGERHTIFTRRPADN